MSVIFSQNEWMELYPAAEYEAKSDRVKKHVVHYLLGQHQPDGNLIAYIGKASPEMLALHDAAVFSLTPLIIAVMQKRDAVVAKLLACASVVRNIDKTDQFGWTALHHAAIASQTIFQMLIGAGANQACTTPFRGTCKDLQALTSLEPTPYSKAKVTGFPDTIRYRDLPYFPKPKDLWQLNNTVKDPLLGSVLSRNWREDPPLVKVAPFRIGGSQLVAGERIPKGKVIGEYGGAYNTYGNDFPKFSELSKNTHSYAFFNFDAKEMGNAQRFINSDFPNLASFSHIVNGVQKVFYCAVEEIKEGEPLVIDYGPLAYDVAYGPQMLSRRKEMHDFFKKGVKNIISEIDQLKRENRIKIDFVKVVDQLRLTNNLYFPLCNPLALIDLHFSNIVPCREWVDFYNADHPLIEIWIKQFNNSATFLSLLLNRLSQIAPRPLLNEWVAEHQDSMNLMTLMKGIEKIDAELNKGNADFKGAIEEWLKTYDWAQDESNVFSFKSRKMQLDRNLAILAAEQKITKKALIQKLMEDYNQSKDFKGSETEKLYLEILDQDKNV